MDRNISTVKKHISPGQITQNELESILNLTETYVTFCIGDMKGQHITVHCLYEHGFRRIIDLQSSSEKLSGQRKQRIWSELEDYTFHGSGAIPIPMWPAELTCNWEDAPTENRLEGLVVPIPTFPEVLSTNKKLKDYPPEKFQLKLPFPFNLCAHQMLC